MANNNKPRLRLIPLGGLGEVGKNMFVVEYGSDMMLIDAGLMFPEDEMLGIDLVLPDFTYVRKNKDKLKGIFITHGHEDHTGALPYLLRDVNVPIYGTRLTLGLIRGKLEEHNLLGSTKLVEIHPNNPIKLGCFKLEFFRMTHSIPDGVGVAIHTPVGLVVHSGDFKLDQTPIDGNVIGFDKISSLCSKGVLALMSDSTNAETPGYTPSERVVGETLHKIFEKADGRVIVASFASHIHRIQQVIDTAHRFDRKLAVTGLSMTKNVEIASQLGYLKIPKKMMIHPAEMRRYAPKQLCVMSTGSQGEPMSALARMANGEHKWVDITEEDTIIISASAVPGNEKSISQTIDRLFRCGASVFYDSISGVHVSGHGAKDELRLMMNLVKPKYFIPIHGEYRHLRLHAEIAEEMGIPKDHIFVASNGDVVEFNENGKASMKEKVPAGAILVDGLGVGDIGEVVLRDRQQLSSDGILIVVVTIDKQTGKLIAGPDLVTRGFVYVRESGALLDEARERVIKALERTSKENITDWAVLKNDVRKVLSAFIYDNIKRRPMIMPIIVEV
ncbi:MAG: ribonuclease J [Candidatus Aquicultor primus]|uniref:Ribonuclease J n=1 Tax=Candidatus Aquicultor primus TaxID=1797195 RepID=A0A1F2UG99_9ACTN|nr:MAG: ribonuclease J [Candidatus Aquicultor primus]